MMRLPELLRFAGVHGLCVVSVEQLAVYRRALQNGKAAAFEAAPVPSPVTFVARSRLPTDFGEFDLSVFRDAQGLEHSALTRGEPGEGDAPPMVRLHSECLTGDAFGSLRCDCGEQLRDAMRRIDEAGRGAILYLRQEGRGIGLGNKIRAYTLQDGGLDTVEANRALGFPDDARRYEVAAAMLEALGIRSLRLLSNNPAKAQALTALGIEVAEELPILGEPHDHNADYRRTKVERMGHDARLLNDPDDDAPCVGHF